MVDSAKEVRTNSQGTLYYGRQHMNTLVLTYQQKLIFFKSLVNRDGWGERVKAICAVNTLWR